VCEREGAGEEGGDGSRAVGGAGRKEVVEVMGEETEKGKESGMEEGRERLANDAIIGMHRWMLEPLGSPESFRWLEINHVGAIAELKQCKGNICEHFDHLSSPESAESPGMRPQCQFEGEECGGEGGGRGG
jgi:hypothetical protein